MVGHEQGGVYAEPFTGSGDQSALHRGLNETFIWSVEPGDIHVEHWYVNGRELTYTFQLVGTSVGATAGFIGNTLTRLLPFGWQGTNTWSSQFFELRGIAGQLYGFTTQAYPNRVGFIRFDQANYPNINNAITLLGQARIILS
jgi:hypothetical protein